MKTVPAYAVRLLLAAKFVARPASNESAQGLCDSLEALQEAVMDFENRMPLIDGVIQESED